MGPDRYPQPLVSVHEPGPRLPASSNPSARSHRYLSRAIHREYPCGARGVVLAFSCPEGDDICTGTLLLQAYGLQAELDSKVLVVDARVVERGGGVSQRLGLADRPGYAEVLQHGIADVAALVQPTAITGVDILPMGTAGAADSRMVCLQQHLASLLEWGRSGYGYVLLQVGSVVHDTRNLVTATQADAVLLLAREHRTMLSALQESRDVLRENGARSIAALLVRDKS